MTIREIRAEVRRMDPTLLTTSARYKSAVMLLSMLVVGTDATAVAAFSRVSRNHVDSRLDRLRDSGIVTADGRIAANWFDEDAGGVEFWLDVAVAEGLMQRAHDSASTSKPKAFQGRERT